MTPTPAKALYIEVLEGFEGITFDYPAPRIENGGLTLTISFRPCDRAWPSGVGVQTRGLDEYGGDITPWETSITGFNYGGICEPTEFFPSIPVFDPDIVSAPYHEVRFVYRDEDNVRHHILKARSITLCSQSSPTRRVSLNAEGKEVTNGVSGPPVLSNDGSVIAMSGGPRSMAPSNFTTIFVRDNNAATVENVAVATDGTLANAFATDPSMSGDGRFVTFVSSATNIAGGGPGDDVFVRDRANGTTALVSRGLDGQAPLSPSAHPDISSDGRYIAFDSQAANLASEDTSGDTDVFLYEMATGTMKLVSPATVPNSPLQMGGNHPSVSATGRYIAFLSRDQLVAADRDLQQDVYVRDMNSANVELVSPSEALAGGQRIFDVGTLGDAPDISADGRLVTYAARTVDSTGRIFFYDVFVTDRVAGTTSQVSLTTLGGEPNSQSRRPSISASSRFVAFDSAATDLVPGSSDSTPFFDPSHVYVRDLQTGELRKVDFARNFSRNGEALTSLRGLFGSDQASVSGDGSKIGFFSSAHNVVCDDENEGGDIFVTPTAGGDGGGGGEPPPLEALKYVALGDSYSSGEGVSPFLNRRPFDHLCHRSEKAWPVKVSAPGTTEPISSAPATRDAFEFHACSGAVIANLLSRHQMKEGAPVPLQIGEIDPDVDLVTISIGGNDAEFADILTFCAIRPACASWEFQEIDGQELSLAEWVDARLTLLHGELVNVYDRIDEAATGNATIVVAGYPHLFADFIARPFCPEERLYGLDERLFINDAGTALDATIASATSEAGVRFASVIETFRGHEVCADTDAITEWIAGIDFAWGIKPNEASFHPTELGTTGYATEVSGAIASGGIVGRQRAMRKLGRALSAIDSELSVAQLTPEQLAEVASLQLDELGIMSLAAFGDGTDPCDGQAVPGQHLVISGDGFEPASTVSVAFEGQEAGHRVLGSIQADSDGQVAANVILPVTITDGTAGFSAIGVAPGGAERRLLSVFDIEPRGSECHEIADESGQLSEDGGPAPTAGNISGLPTEVLTSRSGKGLLESAGDSLDALGSNGNRIDDLRVSKAASSIDRALGDAYWIEEEPSARGQMIFEEVAQAIHELSKMSDSSRVDFIIEALLDATQLLAITALEDAEAAEVDARRIDYARSRIEEGDAARGQDAYERTVHLYKFAWLRLQ